jgi:hypothetical protein
MSKNLPERHMATKANMRSDEKKANEKEGE